MNTATKILQIMPANDWQAHFKNEGEPDILEPVVCFALVEEIDGGKVMKAVRPMYQTDTGIEFCEETSNYTHVSNCSFTSLGNPS